MPKSRQISSIASAAISGNVLRTTQRAEGSASIADTETDVVTITPDRYPCLLIIIASALLVAAQTVTLKLTSNDNAVIVASNIFGITLTPGNAFDYDDATIGPSASGEGLATMWLVRLTAAPAGGEPIKVRGVRNGVVAGSIGGSISVVS